MKRALRIFEVDPTSPAAAPVALADLSIEADTVDAALKKAAQHLADERRVVRSLSCLTDGGLVAYVLSPSAEPEPKKKPRRRKRPPRKPA